MRHQSTRLALLVQASLLPSATRALAVTHTPTSASVASALPAQLAHPLALPPCSTATITPCSWRALGTLCCSPQTTPVGSWAAWRDASVNDGAAGRRPTAQLGTIALRPNSTALLHPGITTAQPAAAIQPDAAAASARCASAPAVLPPPRTARASGPARPLPDLSKSSLDQLLIATRVRQQQPVVSESSRVLLPAPDSKPGPFGGMYVGSSDPLVAPASAPTSAPAPAGMGCCLRAVQPQPRPLLLLPLPTPRELRRSGLQGLQTAPAAPRRFLSGGAASGDGSSDKLPAAARGAAPDAVYNLPNAVSAARLLSGPVIGVWLLQGHYEAAAIGLAISGASDWLDGFLARRMGASSVFGSYLDPLADKMLIGCVAGALLANGTMPVWLAVVVVGRDVLLVSGAFVFRLRGFGWRWPGREAFFRTADAAPPREEEEGGPSSGEPGGGGGADGGGGGNGGSVKQARQGVAFMRPLLVSKANTVLQLVLLGGYLARGMYGWPDVDVVLALEVATATTTVLSLSAYGTMALQGKLFK